MSSWYSGGYDPETEAQAEAESNFNKLFRYYLPIGKGGEITFVDDTMTPMEFKYQGEVITLKLPLIVREHQMLLNGSWKNWFTCLRPTGKPCPPCGQGNKAANVAVYTVIDHNEWTDKNGNVHKDEEKLWVCKVSSVSYKFMKKQHAKRNGLRGCRFEVERLGDKSPNVGDTFEFLGKDELDPKIQVPNYLELFAPKSANELKSVIGAVEAEEEEALPF